MFVEGRPGTAPSRRSRMCVRIPRGATAAHFIPPGVRVSCWLLLQTLNIQTQSVVETVPISYNGAWRN